MYTLFKQSIFTEVNHGGCGRDNPTRTNKANTKSIDNCDSCTDNYFWLLSLGIYDVYKKITHVYEISKMYENLKQRSNAHLVLIESYENCRDSIPNKSRQACVVEMREFADIEGLSTAFGAVYRDIKSDLWPLELGIPR